MIYFWKHVTGQWRVDPDIFMADGVHLSWHEGYPRYFRSVRDCLLRMKTAYEMRILDILRFVLLQI